MIFPRWLCLALTLCSSESNRRQSRGERFFPPPIGNASMPLDFIYELNSVENVDQLLRDFVDARTIPPQPIKLVSASFGGLRNQERRSSIQSPKFAKCEPELTTIKLKNEFTGNVIYYPSCTRVYRCGGCCSHDLLACRPVASEQLQFQVLVTEYQGGSGNRALIFKGRDIVSVEQHTKCKCECKVQPADCSPVQTYDANGCRCICNNKDAEEKCKNESDRKLWSPTECGCICRNISECSTGFYFDPFTCQCIRERKTKSTTPSSKEPEEVSPGNNEGSQIDSAEMNRYNYEVRTLK